MSTLCHDNYNIIKNMIFSAMENTADHLALDTLSIVKNIFALDICLFSQLLTLSYQLLYK